MQKQLSLINWVLLSLIILINCYVVITPFVPAIKFWYKDHFAKQQRVQLIEQVENDSASQYSGPNKLIIPRIFMDQPVLEGPNIYTANKGIWRLPSSSTPDKGGNTVLIGHRFLYSRNPAVFYSLDKMQTGDKIGIYWANKKYLYKVTEVKTVRPDQTDIEAPTEDARLTLYTCTPLWTSKNRLVVVAKQMGVE